MNKDIKAVDDFLDGVEGTQNEEDVLNAEEQDPFSSGNTENQGSTGKTEDETEVKPEPFHKDPKVQKYVQKEIAKALEGITKPNETQRFIQETAGADEDELTDVLTRMIGNDTPEKVAVLKDFKKALSSIEERGAQKAMQKFQSEQQKLVEEDKKAQQALTQGFEDIEEEYGVDLTSNTPSAKKMRNDFVEFVKRVAPKNGQGIITDFPDFSETFQVYQDVKKSETSKTTNRAKDLANRGMSRSTGTQPDTKSKDNSWAAVDKLFSKFTS